MSSAASCVEASAGSRAEPEHAHAVGAEVGHEQPVRVPVSTTAWCGCGDSCRVAFGPAPVKSTVSAASAATSGADLVRREAPARVVRREDPGARLVEGEVARVGGARRARRARTARTRVALDRPRRHAARRRARARCRARPSPRETARYIGFGPTSTGSPSVVAPSASTSSGRMPRAADPSAPSVDAPDPEPRRARALAMSPLLRGLGPRSSAHRRAAEHAIASR